ncbi:PfkB family carbohydrate kinase (plasmid) [Acuticoccus sp. I52.16.1]|uniref:Ribokinase n=2 Tax=Hyphomicrobiales TaxID=356 RepID=E0XWD9_9HYPH|nr:PfkB family carbohydrate kinase [Acuticoccus sp. I52.16.1]ADI18730.1 sugar kinases, ribokinase family [uncultured Rhizobiales bacterium HF4000_32B18]UOM37364.1 PfkB family carbohydrate kinase [Acuticoccus sp. I52.16.1]
MTLWCLGSINLDRFYHVPHIPAPGETLAARRLTTGIGGKGANMAVAAARAGARVVLIGAVGSDGAWARDRLSEWGVDTRYVASVEGPTGHAVIVLAEDGENTIVIHAGANAMLSEAPLGAAFAEAAAGDWCLIQNETTLQSEGARRARAAGLSVAYAAAPFTAEAAMTMAPLCDLMILNRVEMEQLAAATGRGPAAQGVARVVVTEGADGAVLYAADAPQGVRVAALEVEAVDTTGAGDTFTGYLLAGLAAGLAASEAMTWAAKAGALMVTRHGTADAIPTIDEVARKFGGEGNLGG